MELLHVQIKCKTPKALLSLMDGSRFYKKKKKEKKNYNGTYKKCLESLHFRAFQVR